MPSKRALLQTLKTRKWCHPSSFHGIHICPTLVSLTVPESQLNQDTYIRIIRDDTQRSGNSNHIEDGEESMTGRPAKVLVAVRIEFC